MSWAESGRMAHITERGEERWEGFKSCYTGRIRTEGALNPSVGDVRKGRESRTTPCLFLTF